MRTTREVLCARVEVGQGEGTRAHARGPVTCSPMLKKWQTASKPVVPDRADSHTAAKRLLDLADRHSEICERP